MKIPEQNQTLDQYQTPDQFGLNKYFLQDADSGPSDAHFY